MRHKPHPKKQPNTTRHWFDQWSNEYDRTLGSLSFHQGLLDLVVKVSKVKRRDKVLDIGCGTGLLSLKFLQKTDCEIIGIDNSKEMLSIFQQKVKKLRLDEKISCIFMDAAKINFAPGTFDIVASSLTLHHLKEKEGTLKKIHRILKPGGYFLLGDIDMDSTGNHRYIPRFKRILNVLESEWIPALKEVGEKAFVRLYDNGKKHILNEGEYCLNFMQWAGLCRAVGFKVVLIKAVSGHKNFKVLLAQKNCS